MGKCILKLRYFLLWYEIRHEESCAGGYCQAQDLSPQMWATTVQSTQAIQSSDEKGYGQQYDDAGQTQDKDFMLLRFCKLLNSVKRKADKVCLAFTTHIMLIEIQSIPSFSFLLTGKPLKKSEWKTLSPDTLHPYALWNIKMGNFSLMLDTLLPKEIWNIFYIFFFCSKGIFTDSERLYMKN